MGPSAHPGLSRRVQSPESTLPLPFSTRARTHPPRQPIHWPQHLPSDRLLA